KLRSGGGPAARGFADAGDLTLALEQAAQRVGEHHLVLQLLQLRDRAGERGAQREGRRTRVGARGGTGAEQSEEEERKNRSHLNQQGCWLGRPGRPSSAMSLSLCGAPVQCGAQRSFQRGVP